jgi:hypothetical protein
VDIIGSGSPADAPRQATSEADLHLDWDPEDIDPVPHRPFADIVSTEALAVAALVVGAAAMIGLSSLSYLLFEGYGYQPPAPRQQMEQRSGLYGLAAALTLILALGSLLRRPVAGSLWARGLAGAAVLLGLVLAGIALLFLQRAGVVPEHHPAG